MLIRMYDAAGGVYKGAGPSSSPPDVHYKQDANAATSISFLPDCCGVQSYLGANAVQKGCRGQM